MAENNIAGFKKLMRYAQNLAEYEQGIADGIIDENVFVIVLEEKVAKFKGQTFDWSGGGEDIMNALLERNVSIKQVGVIGEEPEFASYLVFDGTKAIMTDIDVTEPKYKIQISFLNENTVLDNFRTLFGCTNKATSSESNIRFSCAYSKRKSSNIRGSAYQYNNTGLQCKIAYSDSNVMTFTPSKGFHFQSESSAYFRDSAGNLTSDVPFYFPIGGGYNTNNDGSRTFIEGSYWIGKIYYIKIWDATSDALVHDLVPTTKGMYDNITEKHYTFDGISLPRKSVDLIDLNTQKSVYPKSHAASTYLSTGESVENAIHRLSNKIIIADSNLSLTSENAIQNKVVTEALTNLTNEIIDSEEVVATALTNHEDRVAELEESTVKKQVFETTIHEQIQNIIDNEEVTSAAINDLNLRIAALEAVLASVNQ